MAPASRHGRQGRPRSPRRAGPAPPLPRRADRGSRDRRAVPAAADATSASARLRARCRGRRHTLALACPAFAPGPCRHAGGGSLHTPGQPPRGRCPTNGHAHRSRGRQDKAHSATTASRSPAARSSASARGECPQAASGGRAHLPVRGTTRIASHPAAGSRRPSQTAIPKWLGGRARWRTVPTWETVPPRHDSRGSHLHRDGNSRHSRASARVPRGHRPNRAGRRTQPPEAPRWSQERPATKRHRPIASPVANPMCGGLAQRGYPGE